MSPCRRSVRSDVRGALTPAHGRDVREWRLKPLRPDNRWLDCLVGCAVAASIQGVAIARRAIEQVSGRAVEQEVDAH